MALDRTRILLMALGVAGLLTGLAYWNWRSPCVDTSPGLRSEVRVLPDGQMLYHNGQCWTTEPMPPRDTPF